MPEQVKQPVAEFNKPAVLLGQEVHNESIHLLAR